MEFDTIRSLIDTLTDLLNSKQVEEIEVQQGDLRVRIRRGPPAGPATPAPAAPSVAAPAVATPIPAEGENEEGLVVIHSPIVGTFYAAPAPGAPDFVRVGDAVEPGQVLCIVEAMKLMNEIEAETGGQIVKRFVSNGQPVEFGEALYALRPSGGK